MKIPPLDLQAEFREFGTRLITRARRVLRGGRYILGAEVDQFEARFARFVGTRYAVGVASGSDALFLALMALGVKAGDEVLTTPLSYIATGTAIARLGAKPVFVDIDPDTFNLDPMQIKGKLSKKTRGILPVHLYGNPCRMDKISSIAKKYGLFVVEDCAQACGAAFLGKPVGSFGDFGAFSFYPTKTLGAMGDGGALTTNNRRLYEKVKSLRRHGEDGKVHSYRHVTIGINSRLDELQAAVLNVKLEHLRHWNLKRRKAAERYDRLMMESGLLRSDRNDVPEGTAQNATVIVRRPSGRRSNLKLATKVPCETPGGWSVYHQYAVCVSKRDRLQKYLAAQGIASTVYYPIPLHLQPCFRSLGYRRGDLSVTEEVCRRVLSLPLYPQISLSQQKAVVRTLKHFFEEL